MPLPPENIRRWKELAVLLPAWLLLMYGLAVLGTGFPVRWRYLHIHQGVFGLLNFTLFYTAIRWPFPQFLEGRKVLPMLARLLLLVAGVTLLKYFIADNFFREEVLYQGYRDNHVKLYRTFWPYARSAFWTHGWVLCAAMAYVLFRAWLEADKRRQQLSRQQQEAEMGILKTQLNVHFLMNSLNSIYSLALVRSPQVIDATRTLSHILEYMTEQPPAAEYRSPLSDEIKYLEDFIAVHRLRTGCDNCVQLFIDGDPQACRIAPMLLVPFVENAFKHGVANQPAKPVTIRLECSPQRFAFTVHNFKMTRRKDKTGGIGLDNVRRRLELVYPRQYELQIENSEEEYNSTLHISW
ncbi:sensor histidine kinase [Chitinophaga sp. GCM10012297]|uniref:Histidine kinase n=1 Tax=Chitinophaga chungangae TaxID=2821488 RepID=A0ABS3YKB2_9BACT|nr:histidine kinase [Chitinophaga chungangae]MBO9155129.1 histidine kinase [Chitinophaga chungangae]